MIWPKLPVFRTVFGLPARRLFVKLYGSTRTSTACHSRNLNTRDNAVSNCHVAGPSIVPRRIFPFEARMRQDSKSLLVICFHREYQTSDGFALSQYVFHHDGRPVGDPRKAWASGCRAAALVKPKLDKATGEPITVRVNGIKETVMVPSRLFHDLWRSGVRNMVRAGVREGVAMAISGHRTRAVFDRYNITSDDDLRQAVRQTTEHLAAQPAKAKVVAIAPRKS